MTERRAKSSKDVTKDERAKRSSVPTAALTVWYTRWQDITYSSVVSQLFYKRKGTAWKQRWQKNPLRERKTILE